jgi:hypothetical protein
MKAQNDPAKWVGEVVLAHYLVSVWIALLSDRASELDMYNVFSVCMLLKT